MIIKMTVKREGKRVTSNGLTIDQFAVRSGFHRNTVRRWVKAGRILSMADSRGVYFIPETELGKVTA